MADSKKYNGSTWEHSLRKLATATDTFTTLPVDVYADGNNATVGISGNTVQNGTPTPDNPIMPQGCGNYSNLFNEATAVYGKYIDSNGAEQTSSNGENNHSTYITVKSGLQYTLAETKPSYSGVVSTISWYTSSKVFIQRDSATLPVESGRTSNTWTAPSNAAYAIINFYRYPNFDGENDMLNEGSTALPYEPYGQYKIPISSASTTIPVYLGEVQTVRQIRKLVLTGQESWQLQSINSHGIANFWVYDFLTGINEDRSALCSHFYQTTAPIADITEPCFSISTTSASLYLRIQSTTASDATEFKAWLEQQYQNGTPVTIWYVLANEETAVVNEPLMKIGDYADTVSGITVPMITGRDTFDVDTTLKPSEASLNYTGWHNATVQEWDGSQWNE
jgi:hypothetical protein